MPMRHVMAARWPLAFCLILASALPGAGQELCGVYQTAPGSQAIYQYHDGSFQSLVIPIDVTFDFACAEKTVSATIHLPITGIVYPWIASQFPMTVIGTSANGRVFQGALLDPGYLFEWDFTSRPRGRGSWNGWVQWSGGRFEYTDISQVSLQAQPGIIPPFRSESAGTTLPEPGSLSILGLVWSLVLLHRRR